MSMPPSQMPSPESRIDLKNLQLLVVEDEPAVRATIVETLQARGAKVVAVDSVRDGLAAIEQQRPDVIISDLHLPDGNGYALMQTAQTLLDLEGAQPLPAIAVSACPQTVNLEAIAAVGFKRYLAKPIRPERLLAIVGWLTGRVSNNRY